MCFCGCILAQCSHLFQNVYRGTAYITLAITSFQEIKYDGLCLLVGALQQ